MANVLIIDDDVTLARLLQNQLLDEGYEVTVAHRGNEGLAEALKAAPDLIMLDVILPDMTGFQMCNQFRKTAATKEVPIIMISAAARFPNQQQYAFDRGANEYILKPFGVFEMAALVNSYIGTKRARSQGTKVIPMNPALPTKNPRGNPPSNGTLSELRSFLKQHGSQPPQII